GKEWTQGMCDASGKSIPAPPHPTSNAHYDKNGNFTKWTSPLTFDLNGDGKAGATSMENGRMFDIDGNGKVVRTAWADKGDGVLAFDGDRDGRAGTTGKELLGNATDLGDGRRFENGFEALKALAVKYLGQGAAADGKLDARELAQLEQRCGLSMLVDGRRV